MIPIRDNLPTHRVPIINYLLIVGNIVAFAWLWLASPAQQETLVYEYAIIPSQFSSGIDTGNLRDVFTSMFMHAGWMHLIGNMLYLWIFGDNVEDRMGHIKYLLFYLFGGVFAAAAHIFVNPGSQIPTVGASGAIAAVLGAYLILYPQSRVATFIPLGFFMTLRTVPASIVLVVWFLLQFFEGVLSLGAGDMGGVAFWAHIGGFVAGVVIGLFSRKRTKPSPARTW